MTRKNVLKQQREREIKRERERERERDRERERKGNSRDEKDLKLFSRDHNNFEIKNFIEELPERRSEFFG